MHKLRNVSGQWNWFPFMYVIKEIFFEVQLWHGGYLQLTHSQRKAFNWQNSAQLTNGLIRKFWGFLEHFEMEVFQVVLLDHPFLKDKTLTFLGGEGIKNWPNLQTDSSKRKLPTLGGRGQNSWKFADVFNGWSLFRTYHIKKWAPILL